MVFVDAENSILVTGYKPQSDELVTIHIKDIESAHVMNEPFSAERKLRNIDRPAVRAILCSLSAGGTSRHKA